MIDALYGCECGCCSAQATDSVSEGIRIDDDLLNEIMNEIYNEEVDDLSGVSPTLFEANREFFRQAVDEGAKNSASNIDDIQEMILALKHSADVFALHRSATQCALLTAAMTDADGNLKSFEQFVKDTQSINSHYNQSWLRTEYDTAILRAQTAADWTLFQRDADVLPNLRWMPTTSVTPREEHAAFWRQGLTLPINHPFWNEHRPGDLWNCKCWLEQTNDEATRPEDMPEESEMPEQKAGLRGNPAKTEEIFSQDHPHFPNACASCPLNSDGKVHGTRSKGAEKGDCNNCPMANKSINRISKE